MPTAKLLMRCWLVWQVWQSNPSRSVYSSVNGFGMFSHLDRPVVLSATAKPWSPWSLGLSLDSMMARHSDQQKKGGCWAREKASQSGRLLKNAPMGQLMALWLAGPMPSS